MPDDPDELFQLVDENDNPIGTATRRECHGNPALIHRGIFVIVRDGHGRVLLQKRSKSKDLNPGAWALSVGGHCGVGETYVQAARREMMEEIGIELPIEHIGTLLIREPRETEMDALFVANIGVEKPKPSDDEIAEVRWFTIDEIKRLSKSDVGAYFWQVMEFYLASA